ncbi:MAG: chloride channel protein [Actinomycetota bacterium]
MSSGQIDRARFLTSVVRAFIIGALSGLFAVAFLSVEHALTGLVWGHDLPIDAFDGGWKAAVIPVAAGLVVGVLYLVFRLPARLPGFIDEVEEGRVEPSTAPGAVVVALVSLVGGASLGPEAPLATGAGGAATWWAERRGGSAAAVRAHNEAAVSGVFGGLLSSPLIGGLLTIELEHQQSPTYTLRSIVPAIAAGVAGFLVVNPVLGEPFLGRYAFETFNLKYWHFAAALGAGIIGAVIAIGMGVVARLTRGLFTPLDERPILRGLIGGLIVGGVGFALPLSMFSGVDQLESAFENAAAIGVVVLLITAAAKIVTLAVSINAGFYGGPFFPTFFIGGTVGVAVNLLIPAFPLALAVGSFMGATAGAVASIPLSILIFAVYVVGLGPPAAGVVGLATIAGFAIIQIAGSIGGASETDAPDAPNAPARNE